MAKARSQWHCTACGATHQGWFGRCPACGEWNTVEERTASTSADAAPAQAVRLSTSDRPQAVPASEAPAEQAIDRLRSENAEVDRVLGGGLVRGSVVLLGGPPGIGKSTLLLQVGSGIAGSGHPVLYASGEESVSQVAGRARRLGTAPDELLLLAETGIERVLEAAESAGEGLAALVVDSIQTMFSADQDGLPGNVGQIRAVTAQLTGFAKRRGVPVIIVGHVTKDGQLAGPRLLEHMVDVVLSFEGDEERAVRLLRATKNRFGDTRELGVFEMTGGGLREVADPSESFVHADREPTFGSCVTATAEGSRVLMVEIEALLAQSFGGSPRRTCVGLDTSRLAMLLAVLDRHGGQFVLDQDVFANVAGGLRIHEPASDLAVLLAVASGHVRKPLPSGLVAIGEVGLTGELRVAPRTEARLEEARRLGFQQVLMPTPTGKRKPRAPKGLQVVTAKTVSEALDRVGLG